MCGSRYTYLRGRAKFFGISFEHLDAALIKSLGAKRKYTKEYLVPLVAASQTWLELCTLVKIQPGNNNFNKLRRRVIELGVEHSHFIEKPPYKRKAITEYLCIGSTISSAALRERLIQEGIKQRKCEDCGISDWRGYPAPLELDHIDSNPMNNELENLRIRCSNCHGVKTRWLRSEAALERKLGEVHEKLFDDSEADEYDDTDVCEEELWQVAEEHLY